MAERPDYDKNVNAPAVCLGRGDRHEFALRGELHLGRLVADGIACRAARSHPPASPTAKAGG